MMSLSGSEYLSTPVDFIVLETQPVSNTRSQTPIIIERPFLATANVIIKCRKVSIRLTIKDMIREVNIFNLGKQSRDIEDQIFEVNLIENITSEHREELKLETESEFELEFINFDLNQIVESTVNWASSPVSPSLKSTNLIPLPLSPPFS